MEKNLVLVVDDEDDFREALARYLSKEIEVAVDEAKNGRIALEKVRDHGDQYCTVLLDLVLGSPSGLEVLKHLKQDIPDLPVIVFTGKDMEAGGKALSLGADRLLHKKQNPSEIASVVRGLAEQDRVLHRLAADTVKASGADLCIVWRLDRSVQEFKVAAWDGKIELDEEYRKSVKLNATDPAIQHLIMQNKPILFQDVTDPKRTPGYKYREEARQRGLTSLASVPLIHKDRTVALLDCYWKHELSFDAIERQNQILAMIKGWADRAAESIRASELSNQFQILLGINQVLAEALDEDRVIDWILAQGLKLLGANMGWIYLIDFETGQLQLEGSRGFPSDLVDQTRDLGHGITGWVAQNGEPLNVSDVRNDPRHSPIVEVIIGSEASAPLMRETQVIGALTVMSKFNNAFSSEDLESLTIFASQATLAVERARLNSLQKQVSEAVVVGKSKVINKIVHAVRDLTGNPTSLWMVEPDGRRLRIKAYWNLDPEFVKDAYLDIKGTSTGQALTAHEIISIPNIADRKRKPRFKYWEKGKAYGWKSALIVPLFGSRDQPLGALCIYGKIIRDFSQWEKDLLSSFANQAAIAFENARLLEIQKGALEVSNLVSATSDQEPTQVAKQSLALIRKVMPFKRASIQLFDGDLRQLVAGRGFNVKTADPWFTRPISTDPLIMKMKNDKKMIRIGDTYNYPGWDFLPGVRSWVGIPLIDEEQIIGMLTMDHNQPEFFASFEDMLFELLGNQVAIAIQKSRLVNDLQKKNARIEMINEFTRKISSTFQEKSIYELVTEGLVKTLNCTHSTLFIREGDRLIPISAKPQNVTSIITHEFKIGEGLAGWSALKKESILSNDATHDIHFVPGMTRTDCDRSIIVAPVTSGREVIGVISVDQDFTNAFVEDDQKLVETLAWQVGISLNNALLYRQEKELGKISQLILQKNLNLSRILEIILKSAIKLTKTESGVIYLVDRGHTHLVGDFEYPKGKSHPLPRFNEKVGITWEIVKSGKEVVISDTKHDDRVNPEIRSLNVNAFLGFPLKMNDEVIGVIFLNDTRTRHFTSAEIKSLSNLANQAAVAISTSRQYQMWGGLSDASVNLTQLMLSENEVLHKILSFSRQILECNMAVVFPYDEFERIFIVNKAIADGVPEGITFGGYEDNEMLIRGVGKITGKIAENKTGYLVVENTDDNLRYPFLSRKPKSLINRAGIKSFIGIRLQVAGNLKGILFFDFFHPRRFSQAELRAARLIANQAAVAVENAGLYKQRLDDLTALQEINQAITTQEINEIARLITEKANELMRADVAELWIQKENKLVLENIFSPHPTFIMQSDDLPIDEHSINGYVMLKRRAYNCRDVHKDNHYKEIRKEVCSNLAVPLFFSKNEAIGTLSVESVRQNAFSNYKVRLLQSLADQAAIAIRNNQLFTEIRFREQQLVNLHKVVQQISAHPTDLTGVLQSIVDSLIEFYPDSSCAICLYDADKKELGQRVAKGRLENDWHEPRINGTTWHIIDHGKPIYIKDVNENNFPSIREEMAEAGVRSIAYLPLRCDDRLIGLLYLNLFSSHDYSKEEKRLLTIFANQASIAINTARLFGNVAEDESSFIREKYATDLAHRLKNYLGIILANTDNILEKLHQPDEVTLRPDELKNIFNRMKIDLQLVINEATMLRLQPRPEKITDLNLLIDSIVNETRLFAPDNVNIIFQESRKLPSISSIRFNIAYALRFLIDNAVESLEVDGGNIRIKAYPHKDDRMVEIEISDTGPKIPDANLTLIFQAGFTTKESGSGYGLWRARRLIEAVKGNIILMQPLYGKQTKAFVIKIPDYYSG